jgi:deazaflavin-dependent oxidoreductase (nitroreductase family)
MSGERAFTDSPQFKVMRTVMGAANPIVRLLLGGRFAGPLGRVLLLLEFQGRTSGKRYRTPVGYVRDGNQIVIVTSPAYRWWRNVVGGAPVRVRVDGAWQDATARVLLPDDSGYDEAVALQVRTRGPNMLRGFGVPVDDQGRVPEAARADAPAKAHIVRIDLPPQAGSGSAG